jgi:hypothetical protein
MESDPNGSGNYRQDIANGSHNWLVGQMADVVASVVGPPVLTNGASYEWSLPGNVLRTIDEPSSASTRAVVGVTTIDDAHPGVTGAVGYHRPELAWFWVSTTSSVPTVPDTDVVSVSISGIAGATYTASTTFNVYTPDSSVTVGQGAPGIFYWPSGLQLQGWWVGMEPVAPPPWNGVTWTATVPTPTGFTAGRFQFVQKINSWRYEKFSDGSQYQANYQGYWVLDTRDPYGGATWITGPVSGSTGDSPGNGLNDPDIRVSGANDSFQTYLMFMPPGANSQWVPLKMEAWSYYIEVQRATASAAWTNVGSAWQNIPAFARQTAEPEWSALAKANLTRI